MTELRENDVVSGVVADDPDEGARWLADLRRGSRAAFARIYVAEKQRIFGFLVRLARDRNVAADLFQNTWLKLARSASTLREDTDIRSWLFAVARNEYRSYCRAQMLDLSRLLVLDRELFAEDAAARDVDAELGAVDAALTTLPDADREVLLLVCVEGFEAQDAARLLGISYSALRQRLARARKRLAEALEASDLPPLALKSRSS